MGQFSNGPIAVCQTFTFVGEASGRAHSCLSLCRRLSPWRRRICTTFLVPFLILCPVFFTALPVEWAASLVSCLIPPLSCCAMAPSERAKAATIAHRNFNCIDSPRWQIGFLSHCTSCLRSIFPQVRERGSPDSNSGFLRNLVSSAAS